MDETTHLDLALKQQYENLADGLARVAEAWRHYMFYDQATYRLSLRRTNATGGFPSIVFILKSAMPDASTNPRRF